MKIRSLATTALGVCALLLAFMPTLAQSSGRKMYVKVDSTSPDAVVQSSTDFFDSEPLGLLRLNDEVEMLTETDGEYVKIRCTIKGEQLEGWVKRLVLTSEPMKVAPRVSDRQTLGAEYGGRHHVDTNREMRESSAEMDAALKRIDEFEAFLNKRLGGDAKSPKPDAIQQNIKDFAREAALEPGSMK